MSDSGDPAGPEDRLQAPPSDGQAALPGSGSGGDRPAQLPGPGPITGRSEADSSPSDDKPQERLGAKPTAGVDALALAALLLPVPWYAWSVGIVYWVGTLLVDPPWARTVLGVWLLSGAVMLWRPIEQTVARVTFQLRHPIQSESDKLGAAWAAVTENAQMDSTSYSLLIEDSDDVSSSASVGRVVAVTQKSLKLPTPQLEAALAHELGHHLDGYSLLRAVGLWYSLPARATAWLIRNFGRIMHGVPVLGCLIAGFVLLSLLGIILTALIFDYVPLALFGIVLVLLAPVVLAWLDRLGEKNADKRAADRGYGPALLEILYDLHTRKNGSDRRVGGAGAGVLSSQPGVADRIRALEKYLSQKSG